jgi:hypothetical protein
MLNHNTRKYAPINYPLWYDLVDPIVIHLDQSDYPQWFNLED